MAWILLIVAGFFETVWAVALGQSNGFTKLVPSVITVVFAGISFWMLGYAMKTIPVSTAYGVWVAIGTFGAAIVGIITQTETMSLLKGVSLVLLIVGVIGLRMSS